MTTTAKFHSVYGPVSSWRYGRSLGIDPIGTISTCSFNCVYCQLGEIEQKTSDRASFIPTTEIIEDLQAFAPWDVDVITLSGSGEPTLALNLGEIILKIKELTNKPVAVLTNGTLLIDPKVRQELSLADKVAVKLDSISEAQLQRSDRPVKNINWNDIWTGIEKFRAEFTGELAIQTMILTPWDSNTQTTYIRLMQSLLPDEIQLNTPSRPKPLKHELEARGNHISAEEVRYPVVNFRQINREVLQDFANKIYETTNISVRCSPSS
jgi:wyosine [tRNA(Phe)-imidazoG37] synthetase (radical SAM superfamily)